MKIPFFSRPGVSDFAKSIARRLAGAAVAAGAGFLASKGIVNIDPTAQEQLKTALEAGIMFAAYGITHATLKHKAGE